MDVEIKVGKGSYLFIDGECKCETELPQSIWLFVKNKTQIIATTKAKTDNISIHTSIQTRKFKQHFRFECLLLPVLEDIKASLLVELRFGRDIEIHNLGELDISSGIKSYKNLKGCNKNGNITVCMATFNPERSQFKKQIESIRSQSYDNWKCLIVDDHSSDDSVAMIEDVIKSDERFHLMKHQLNVGFYYNFERALYYVSNDAEYVALSDQDDVWDNNKLETLVERLDESENLIYSDQRIINDNDTVLFKTYWRNRKNNYQDLGLMVLANTVTGAALLFRSSILKQVLPFPNKIGDAFHDHWIGCVALCIGKVGYVDKPLYSYRQHDQSVIGHCDFPRVTARDRIISILSALWRGVTTYGYINKMRNIRNSALAVEEFECRRLALISNLLILRCRPESNRKVRALNRFKISPLSGIRLLVWHVAIIFTSQTTDDAEIRLASGYLLGSIHRSLVRTASILRAFRKKIEILQINV